jgi:hypothetical protein
VRLDNRRFFYLFRNGSGDTLSHLNDSAVLYINAASEQLDNERIVAILLIVGSVVILLVCAGIAIIPSVVTIERSKREAWEIFFEIPVHLTRYMK